MRMPPIPPKIDRKSFTGSLWRPEHSDTIQRALSLLDHDGRYRHWDKIRFLKPPAPLTREQMWTLAKFTRLGSRRLLPFDDKIGGDFHFVQIGRFLRSLHEIDSNARGTIGVPGPAANAEGRDAYLQRSLIEEPFSSSVLEGAATTRDIAKRLIEEGRTPKTVDERMVLNNYRAMEFIREHRHEPLSVERILELHRILTEGTLERPEKCGVFRAKDDDVRVVDSTTGETLHMPPSAEQLPARIARLCQFANSESTKGEFLHPVIRAIILHFMLAYDHPFWDGNGRCARALFYWCVLRHGYWLLEYVSISAVLRRSPSQYGLAFLYTETDDGDVTYFIDHQLGVVERALADLQAYLDRKASELRDLQRTFANLEGRLNRRQFQIMQDALKRPNAQYDIAAHEKLHGVSYLTARSDLERLAELGFLRKIKRGVKSVFVVPKDLKQRVNTSR
jgi:Fic family protein